MNHGYKTLLHSLLFIFLGMVAAIPSMAQVNVSIGAGSTNSTTTGAPAALQDRFEGSRSQFLYRANELQAAGMGIGLINNLQFNVSSITSFSGAITGLTIKVLATNTTTLTAGTWDSGAVSVYGPFDYVPTVGVNTFPFSTPFQYDGQSNLIVEICNGGSGSAATNNVITQLTTGLTFNGSRSFRANGQGNLCSYTGTVESGTPNSRPNITFGFTASNACSGTPVAGTAQASATSVCGSQPFRLSVTGLGNASGVTFQWQVSTNNGASWANIPGATTAVYTRSQTVNSQYRLQVTCTSGGATASSTPVTVNSPTTLGGTYTINSAQPTNFPVGTNFASFNDAYNALKCGVRAPVVFSVQTGANAGVYTEQLRVEGQIPGASPVNTITFQGNGNTIRFPGVTSSERAVIKLSATNYFVIDSLVVNNANASFGYGIWLTNDADSNVVRRCVVTTPQTITSAGFGGIVMNGTATDPVGGGVSACNDNLVERNTVVGGFVGISLSAAVAGTSANRSNTVQNNIIQDFHQTGIYIAGGDLNTIVGNTITRPTRTAFSNVFNGILFNTQSASSYVAKNRIHSPYAANPAATGDFYGIAFTNAGASSGFENIVENNVIAASQGNGLAYGLHISSSPFVYALHNTISLDSTLVVTGSNTRGISVTNSDGFVGFNNLVSIKRGGVGQKHGIYFSPITTGVSDYNVIFVTPGPTNYFGFANGNRQGILDWRNATQNDLKSYTADPFFVDPVNFNFEPDQAAFDNRGLYVNVDTDINGVVRPTTGPDIGAYQFIPPGCTLPVVAGTASLSRIEICEGTTTDLLLQGSSFGLGQEFQWQSASSQAGPYTSFGQALSYPDTIITGTTDLWLRMAVTCGSQTVLSNAVFLKVNPYLRAGTYSIDSNLATTYVPGVAGGNFRSITDAVASMGCGINGPVVFNVTSTNKVYNEQLILKSIPNLSATNTLTFNGNGQRIRFNSTVNNSKAVIMLDSVRHVTIDSFVVDALNTDLLANQGVGIQLVNNSDSNIIRRNDVQIAQIDGGQSYVGILINGSRTSTTTATGSNCDDNLVTNNRVRGGFNGIAVISSASQRIFGNRLVNNRIEDFHSNGVLVGDGADNTIVEGNNITRPARAISNSTITGILLNNASSATEVKRNRIHNLAAAVTSTTPTLIGIHHNAASATPTTAHLVENNLIYGFHNAGNASGIANTDADFVDYYHNTVLVNDSTVNNGFARGFNQNTQATGLFFLNNIVAIDRRGTGQKHVLYYGANNTAIESNYNDLYVAPSNTNGHIGFFNVNQTTLANWRLAADQDSASLNFDPIFRNVNAGDLTFTSAPLDNKADPTVGTLVDFFQTIRPATPDMGAIEFAVPPCAGTPVTAATISPNNGLCVDVPIVLDIPGTVSLQGQIFIWENAPTATGPWTRISDTLFFPRFNTLARAASFYRAQIRCGSNVIYSTVVQANMNFLLPAGTYTIDNTRPTTPLPIAPGGNFNSFNEAVSQLYCGITGPITFNVVNTGTNYNEQVRIGKVPGMSAANRITFQNAPTNATQAILTFNSTDFSANYTLRLDSASFITVRNLAIRAESDQLGRVVDFTGNSSSDSLVNNTITTPVVQATSNTQAAVTAVQFRGNNLTIKGNSVLGGSAGIWLTGQNGNNLAAPSILLDSNTVNDHYFYGIFASLTNQLRISRNRIVVDTNQMSGNSFGILAQATDTATIITGNTVFITRTNTQVTGIQLQSGRTVDGREHLVSGNTVIADTGNTGNILGIVLNGGADRVRVVNNAVAIVSSGNLAYGIQSNNSSASQFLNNSVQVGSAGTQTYPLYIQHTAPTAGGTVVRNNILSHAGGNQAYWVADAQFVLSDYNFLYTTGNNLVRSSNPNRSYAVLQDWRNLSNQDRRSIVHTPSFVSATNLRPNVNDPQVWAMHGRGVQVLGNNVDFDGRPRPTTLAAGVPDMGAFEFIPAVNPPDLQSVPAGVPTTNSTQYWMFGSDTVARINWRERVPTVPVTMRRFSGVAPRQLPNTFDSMYFYTEVNQGVGLSGLVAEMQLHYVESWLGTIQAERQLGLGRTTPANNWVVGARSAVAVATNYKYIFEDRLVYLNRFTGLKNPFAPPIAPDKDSSNRGKRFWLAYGQSESMNGSTAGGIQEQLIYLSASAEPAQVQIRINGTSWFRNYIIPANTTIATEPLPKTGPNDCRLFGEGKFTRGISIVSDVPITAYTHQYANTNSGATLLLPVGVWGYEYYSVNNKQNWSIPTNIFTHTIIVADNDSTRVEITPSRPTEGGRPANVPFSIYLNKGEVYNVLGANPSAGDDDGEDLTGTRVKSIPNLSGKCFPIGVFSGSTRTGLGCNNGAGSSGDFAMQQIFPFQAWGRRYYTAPTSNDAGPNAGSNMTNIFRIIVREPATVVRRNNVVLTGLVNNRYYQYDSGTPDSIVADRPILVAQYMSSSGSCPNTGGDGDPEMFIISPVEQGVKEAIIYRQFEDNIESNWATLIVPTAGLSSLRLNNALVTAQAGVTYIYNHSRPGYSVVTRRWASSVGVTGTDRFTCDSAFTGLMYGLGGAESYGVNLGTLVRNLNSTGTIDPTEDGRDTAVRFICNNSPFVITAQLPVRATSIRWEFSKVPGLTPSKDTVIANPVPSDSVISNLNTIYTYRFGDTLRSRGGGFIAIPIIYTSPFIESCDNTRYDTIFVQVIPTPPVEYSVNFSGCVGGTANFIAADTTSNGIILNNWRWTLPNNQQVNTRTTSFTFPNAGTFPVRLNSVTADGCLSDSTFNVVVSEIPTVAFARDTVLVCLNSPQALTPNNVAPGVVYNWYSSATATTPLFTGNTFTTPPVTGPVSYFVDAVRSSCVSTSRTRITVDTIRRLAAPVATAVTVDSNAISYAWNPVPGAKGYQVSVNGGAYTTPSSGATGTTHNVTGLTAYSNVRFVVRALGDSACQTATSDTARNCVLTNIYAARDSFRVCPGTNAVVSVNQAVPGISYSWWTAASGGTQLGSGSSYAIPNATATTQVFVQGLNQANGCASNGRDTVTVRILPVLAAPVLTQGGTTANSITFNWNAVPGALRYEVSVNGAAFTTPSTGAQGLSHTVSGLTPLVNTSLVVRALTDSSCQTSISNTVTGCIGTTVTLVSNSQSNCTGNPVTFTVSNPAPGVTYNWYRVVSGGNILFSGLSFTPTVGQADSTYYVEGVGSTGCTSARVAVTVVRLTVLQAPVVRADSITSVSVRFVWNAVPNAVSYEVRINGTGAFVPANGALSHTVSGLQPSSTVSLEVRAVGGNPCQNATSASVSATTLPSGLYLPNAFSPNGDGRNDRFTFFSYTVREVRLMVFNQYGEKIWETTDPRSQGWDGTFKGKMQPVGVYMYVGRFVLTTGEVVERKGSINLIR